MAIKC